MDSKQKICKSSLLVFMATANKIMSIYNYCSKNNNSKTTDVAIAGKLLETSESH